MKTKLQQILAVFLTFALLSACANTKTEDSAGDLNDDAAITHNSQLSNEEEPLEAAQSEPIVESVTYANIGFKENDVFSTDSRQSFLPVSCVYDGEQVFVGGFGENSERFDHLEGVLAMAPAIETLELMNVKERMYIGSERPDYGFDWVATTGDWELFPEKITYTCYDLEHQPNNLEWIEYFCETLGEYEIDSPVVIKDSWAFLWGGIESVIVTATNVVPCENGFQYYDVGDESIPEDLPVNKNPGVYLISVLFRKGQEPFIITDRINSLTNDMGRSVLTSDSELGSYSRSISVVQYNENGNTSLYPVYEGHLGVQITRLFWYPPEYLLCDADGNGEIELIVYHRAMSSLYAGCEVYNLVEGMPIPSYNPILI